ncbi:bifunctional 2-C-methyl-D-erythritol 4-phosphate cytidylyltransferase/2-C-methyl-D-erythritol 2,4-cyclodiphosphate synthase [Jannaschia sp. Os4]|uniref:bifunctional 2-C-methyl-D-erythritol 4-phosphate cytidylyltransferase/2-C-methyl-D-erythritol 2,4-cyclodiphosphate synthase n=1 Tax=Jannaschia sp. Os4 TaxID=2807617 RepID=UPI00193A4324|nr:bifunctional 2-C-methyl-D-erythritol 4-phosphate cytidylyltransferase/2-C-methyl-D-erythritol 2,4-cyclodiphosphate synthase [Jannaschia sp. Os4]MBM2576500.1 bifunctional 2-C-methyl-D-erythritol 4-phosphate cytidylyltransferase/2-C-methyl-D-erythritol 2,4-cyclodiphosphate synthase [Jannaschia sp. Os4]
MDVAVLIVAAGRGTRAGGAPKQWRAVAGRPVLSHALAAFDGIASEVVVAIHPDDRALARAAAPGAVLVEGGASRDASVAAGLAAVTAPRVLIHDAARATVPRAVIERVVAALDHGPAAAPALKITDALWRGDDIVEGTQAREGLWRAQTPQGFHTDAIRAAHAAHPGGAADDVEVARAAGLTVRIVEGDERNIKITTAGDFARAEALLGGSGMDVRVGNGFDVHRFGPGDHAMLCGVAVPHDRGLQGHSDADVGLHVLADALYGAMAEGDIGRHFPPSDPRWKGEPSETFLRHAADLARAKGWRIGNLDVTLICERPKVGPHAEAMRAEVARIADVDVARVSVKATTTERLGFAGREEGIAAQATATVLR